MAISARGNQQIDLSVLLVAGGAAYACVPALLTLPHPSSPHKQPSTHIHSLSLPLPPAIKLYPAPGFLLILFLRPYPLSLCLAVPWSPLTPHPMPPFETIIL